MVIGIPKEIMPGENRVSATPETVKKMVQDKLAVLVEKGAGRGSFYHDEDYLQAGAKIVDSAQEIYEQADVILKVKEPQYNIQYAKNEAEMMRPGQILIAFIHPASPVNHDMVRTLARKKVTTLTLDDIPRITRAQTMDALTSMSTCAGYKGLIMAANELPIFIPQIFTAVGMIKPIEVLVVGAGVGGLQAIATARRLGAITHAADIRPDAAEQAKSLGAKIIDTGVPPEEAIGEGGYALQLSEQRLETERQLLAPHLGKMDIVFLSALVPGKVAPIIISEEMVKMMKPGSVIVDISIDQGGNCAITPEGRMDVFYGVTCIGIKNIPGLLPQSATWMFAHNVYNLMHYLCQDGCIVLDHEDEIIKSALTTYNGEIVHKGTREAMGL